MVGAVVVSVIVTLPFLSGAMLAFDAPETGVAGFCPGATLPPGLVQVLLMVVPFQSMATSRFPLPSPVITECRVRVEPLSVRVGSPPCLNAGLDPKATEAKTREATTAAPSADSRRMVFSFFVRRDKQRTG